MAWSSPSLKSRSANHVTIGPCHFRTVLTWGSHGDTCRSWMRLALNWRTGPGKWMKMGRSRLGHTSSQRFFFWKGGIGGFLLEIAMENGDPGHSFPVQDVTRCQEGPSGATLTVFKRRRGRHRDIGWHYVFLINKHSWKQDHHAHFISNVLWGCTYLLRRDLFFVLHALQERGNWKNTYIYIGKQLSFIHFH